MPETATVEIPAEKVMRQWYLGKLAERMMQATAMVQDRSLLRRGARKMQDGTLGTSEGDGMEDDPVNIHIGDMVVSQNTPPAAAATTTQSAEPMNFFKKAALTTALTAGLVAAGGGLGVGIPWLAGAFDKPDIPAAVDTDTQYELRIGGGE